MKLSQLLLTIEKIADKAGFSEVFCVGGIPRDKVRGRLDQINDIDLTCGNKDSLSLAQEISYYFKSPNVKLVKMPDNHSRIYVNDLKLDFSTNFNIPGIESILKSMNVDYKNEMLKEIYSRDFTCNSLLMTMDLKTIKDLTGRGIKDIENKVIETILSPEITLGYDNKRIIRSLYLSCKLGFSISDNIKEWIKKNPEKIANVKPKSLIKKINKAMNYDEEKFVSLCDELGLWKFLPSTPRLIPYMTKAGRI